MDGSATFSRGIISGIIAIAEAHRWHLELLGFDPKPGSSLFDADVIVFGSPRQRKLIAQYKRKIKIGVMADFTAQGVACVDVDDYQVGVTAAQHLLERGLRSLTYMGQLEVAFSANRYAGFRATVEAAELSCQPPFQREVYEPGPRTGDGGMYAWLESLPKPIGILAGCDEWARRLNNACHTLGLRVPEDIAIVGVDNDEIVCSMTFPALSSVAVPWKRLGETVAVMIDKAMHGKRLKPALTLIPPIGVVTRHSSDILAVDDQDVRAALEYIRANAHRPIQVPDILKAVPIYRERLHRLFHHVVGRTVMQEVRRLHVEQARRLLDATDLSIPEIARRSGFSNYRQMNATFRQELGITPGKYRRQAHVRPE